MSRKQASREIAQDCLAVRTRMLSRMITGIYDDAFRPFGMTTSQANLLAAIAEIGPVQPSALADALHLEKSTLSRNLAIMKKRGWIRVLPGEDDRSHALTVTAQGTKLIEKAFPAWRKAQESAVEILGQDGASLLKDVANRFLPGP